MSQFFIERPIFAWVIALVIMLAGALSIFRLPIAQYPSIAPPTITINATYPGASAKTVEDTVTQIIEQRMTGLDGLRYITSTSDSAGSASIVLTFNSGVDPDIAQVQVQNKLKLAETQLPQEVQQQGVTVVKSVRNFIMVIGFYSEDGSMNRTDIADYIAANVQEVMSRVPGVGELTLFGSQYAMRIWLDPDKLSGYKLTPADVATAIRAQNVQIAAGQLGGLPAVPGQQLNATISAQGRLQTPAQFESVVLRTGASGATVRLRDVARVELGGENYGTLSFYNGKPSSGLAVRLATGANALATADAVKAKAAELEKFFPPGLKAVVAYDTTPFIRLSIQEVVKTLLEAFVLVVLVMYLFLQNLRATLIPAIAVPVVLLGTFGVMQAFGFSINVLTMFGVVLTIGLLVDDAIVVVENVERLMHEEGLSPKEATKKSMGQITGALVGIALVLAAVFIPMAFFGGSTGVIYRQFSITMASAMLLSVSVALILSPALCATLLKPVERGSHGATTGFFGWFNRFFDRGSSLYRRIVGRMLDRPARWLAGYAVMIVLAVFMLLRMPTSFLPDEDQGILFAQVVLPAGATQERTLKVLREVERHFLEDEKNTVQALFTVAGFSFSGSGQNAGIAFVRLKDWKDRPGEQNSVKAVAGRAMAAFSKLRDAMVFAFPPPAVLELGVANGFDLYLQDRAGAGHEALIGARNQLLGMAAKDPTLVAVRPNGQEDTPQFRIDVDTVHAGALGLAMADVNATLSAAWGSALRQRLHRQGPREEGLHAGRRAVPHGPGGPGQVVRAQCAGRHGAVFDVRKRHLDLRFAATGTLQRRARRGDPGPGGTGPQFGRGDVGDGKPRRTTSTRVRRRLDRAVLRRAAVGRPGAPAVRAVDHRRVPVSGGTLRELVDPDRRAADRAARRARRADCGQRARVVRRRVLPGRPADDDRSVGEERDPDHPVRAEADGRRRRTRGGDARGRAPAAASDPDDVAGLRRRSVAARACDRRRFRQPERDRYRRFRRHGRGDISRPAVRAAVLRGREAARWAGGPQGPRQVRSVLIVGGRCRS